MAHQVSVPYRANSAKEDFGSRICQYVAHFVLRQSRVYQNSYRTEATGSKEHLQNGRVIGTNKSDSISAHHPHRVESRSQTVDARSHLSECRVTAAKSPGNPVRNLTSSTSRPGSETKVLSGQSEGTIHGRAVVSRLGKDQPFELA